MNTKNKTENKKKIWISTTGYRIFLEFNSLLIKPRTIEELVEIIKNDSHFNKEISKDTIRFDINTLRAGGCIIQKPSSSNNHKYQLIYHPFKLNFSLEELKVFTELRDKLSSEISLDEVFILNNLYEKIVSLTLDNDIMQNINDTKALPDINPQIVQELFNLKNKKVQIKYNSPQYGIEDTDIIPINIIYENKKVYLWAYHYKYQKNSLFEFSKILKINSVYIYTDNIAPCKTFKVIYEIENDAVHAFELKDYEKILEKKNNIIRVEANVANEFMFIQRLFLFGRNFRIIEPDFFRERLINKIKLIQKGYKQ